MKDSIDKIALGTWLMGGTKEPDLNNDDENDIKVIQLAIENGVRLIDTAQNYAGGKCEELVGRAVKPYKRSDIKILTKQKKSNLSYDDVIKGCNESLGRLDVDYIDYFVCHAPNPDFDIKEFFDATNYLYKKGLIKHVGVSNFGPGMLTLAQQYSHIPVALNQVSFSLIDYDVVESGTYEFCRKNKIQIQAYRTLVSLQANAEVFSALGEVSRVHRVTEYQVALAYLNSYKGVSFTVRSSSNEHWQQIKEARNLKLSDSEIDKLKQIHAKQKGAFSKFLSVGA